jgi:hypothetical protein
VPLPEHQINALREGTESHESRLTVLNNVIRLATEEAAFHQALVDLARNERLASAISDYYDGKPEASQFGIDPTEYCRRESIMLPEGVTLEPIIRHEGNGLVANVHRGAWEFEISWLPDRGFTSMLNTQALRQWSGVVNYVDQRPEQFSREDE